eukprot:CAMPEP_0185616128 /NCGR_PEP_ID=MMETSP0436-20130131/38380_1 /TAXON_ID=626734 ORGANISM="Favella taraikaensis, Strain Fe Narragansett Bay" /NCGR_SAMPLE_ID=MMETSP0436 /ASSEMBLY_ACC=CAM_ASM_000390 /LENGTH=42 /DNA_ID= /DNA_START= /DNA_END= /DNA_ORIENTATION=
MNALNASMVAGSGHDDARALDEEELLTEDERLEKRSLVLKML